MATDPSMQIEKLTKENYDTWKLQMEAILIKNDYWGYVTGTTTKPTGNGTEISSWERNDRKAKADIILAMNPSELCHIKHCQTSQEAWNKLNEVYQSRRPARKAELLKQLLFTKMTEADDMTEHLNKFFNTVYEISEMEIEVADDLLSILLLYSIPNSYENFRCAIETRDVLPKPEILKIKLLEEASARKGMKEKESQSAFYVRNSGIGKFKLWQEEMNPNNSESMEIKEEPLDPESLLEQFCPSQERQDFLESVNANVEPHYTERSYTHHEPIINEEEEVPTENDKPTILSFRERSRSVKLELNTDVVDFGIWKNEPISSDTPKNYYTVHTEKDLYKCSNCNKAFNRKSDLKMHMKIHAGDKLHECSVCRKTFTTMYRMRQHAILHAAKKPHECNVCGKAFTTKRHMNVHTVVHTGEKPYKCSICGKSFRNESSMKRHMLAHKKLKPHECHVCGTTFARKDCLTSHMMIHTGKKPHECSVCKKAFSRRGDMKHHMMIHTREKLHECSICQEVFNGKLLMKRHMAIHSGKRFYECDICGNSFLLKDSLRYHVFLHFGEKPYNCGVCHKMFARKGNVKRHMVIHTGVKPHECSVCGKSFTQRSVMMRHMSIHVREGSLWSAVSAKNRSERDVDEKAHVRSQII